MISKKVNSVQEWLPVDEILENGIIKVKNKNYIKILKIIPINFELKSNLEKEAILNSYKIFLKTCNFDIQILIQSKKEDLSKHISNINCQKKKEEKKLEQQRQNEASFKKSVDTFRKNTAKKAAQKISSRLGISTEQADEVEAILSDEINTNSPDMGIKSIIDSQKKKLLISQTYRDKDLADIIYNMLVFNNVPPEDIIYTNCDDEVSRIPEGDVGKSGIYDYLRDFFVDSYSTQKIYVIFVTSHNTKSSWGALMEVGAAWITQVEHKIFNIYDFRPEHPLDDEQQWHSSSRDDDGNLYMSKLSVDIFAQKIEYICDKLGYKKRTRQENKDHLSTLVKVTPR